MAHISLHLLP
jgi:hypothetical protein